MKALINALRHQAREVGLDVGDDDLSPDEDDDGSEHAPGKVRGFFSGRIHTFFHDLGPPNKLDLLNVPATIRQNILYESLLEQTERNRPKDQSCEEALQAMTTCVDQLAAGPFDGVAGEDEVAQSDIPPIPTAPPGTTPSEVLSYIKQMCEEYLCNAVSSRDAVTSARVLMRMVLALYRHADYQHTSLATQLAALAALVQIQSLGMYCA
jgi:hypothetical protein